MAINTNALTPTVYTKSLIGDLVQAPGGSVDSNPTATLARNPANTLTLPVSAILELQSTTGALLVPRMTTAQRNAMDNTTSTVADGMLIYNTTDNEFNFYEGSTWVSITSAAGVAGPATSTDQAIARWDGTQGDILQDSLVIISDTGDITGVKSLTLGTGSSQTGTIDFLNSTNSNVFALRAGATGSSLTFTLPTADGAAANSPLVTNAAGVLSFGTSISLGNGGATTGTIVLRNSSNANTLTLQAGASGANLTFTFPTDDGAHSNAPLVTDGSGVFSFGTSVDLGTSSTTTGTVVLRNSSNTNTFTLQPGATGSNITLTLPTADPTINGAPLVATTAGVLSFNNQAIITKTVTLSQTDVQGAAASPVSLIGAPGAGETILVVNAAVYTNFQTTAFAGGGTAIIQYGNTIDGAGTNALAATIPSTEITASASQIYALNGNTGNALTGITNEGIFFSNQTDAFTGGSAASTVVITLQYMIIAATV